MDPELEPEPKPTELDPTAGGAGHEEEDDPIVAVEKNAKGESVAPVADLIRYRKEAKSSKREVDALRTEVEQLRGIKQNFEQYAPILQRIQQDPSILTRAAQPKVEEDIEAQQVAEDLGLITADSALDVKRARRIMDRIDARAGRVVDQRIAPVANATAGQIADGHRQRAKTTRMQDGSLVASHESIDEVYGMLPAELLANASVAALMPIMAAGLDKMRGRTPKPPVTRLYDDPFFSEPAGGPGRRTSVLTDDDKKLVKSLGLDEKKYTQQVEDLAANGRRGVALE